MPPVYRLIVTHTDSLETQSIRKHINNSLDSEKIRAVIFNKQLNDIGKASYKLI